MSRPFVIFGLGRSRTYWASRFLSYGDYHCAHEQARHVRSLADVRAWLAQDCTGTAETAGARWWRLILHYRPALHVVTIRRPVAEVVDSFMRLDMRGVCAFDRAALAREVAHLDRALDQIERHVPEALSVQFSDLAREDVCARLFEHCLPYKHDPAWWAAFAPVNLQCNMPALMRHYFAHRPQIDVAAKQATRQMRRVLGAALSSAEPDADGVVIRREPLAAMWRDCQALMSEHCEAVGERTDQWKRKNWPMFERLEEAGAWDIIIARVNGRPLGYLTSIVGPSLEYIGPPVATQTPFFVSADAKGLRLGLRLQRAAIEAARSRGAKEVFMRAGVRGEGPRLGTLYEYLGAEEFGRWYRLDLKVA